MALTELGEQSDAPKPKLLATDRAVFLATVDPDNIAFVCHWKCLDMTKQPHRNRLLESFAFVFEPSAALQKMRRKFYQRHGASLIRPLLGMTFPPEVSLMIASHLPRQVLSCLAVLHGMEAHCLATSGTHGAREFTYEGRKYIPNSPNLRAGRLDMVAKSWSPSCTKDPIHFGLDHLGIRAIMSGEWTGEDPEGPPNQELWWKTVYRWERAFHTFKFSNDVGLFPILTMAYCLKTHECRITSSAAYEWFRNPMVTLRTTSGGKGLTGSPEGLGWKTSAHDTPSQEG